MTFSDGRPVFKEGLTSWRVYSAARPDVYKVMSLYKTLEELNLLYWVSHGLSESRKGVADGPNLKANNVRNHPRHYVTKWIVKK